MKKWIAALSVGAAGIGAVLLGTSLHRRNRISV